MNIDKVYRLIGSTCLDDIKIGLTLYIGEFGENNLLQVLTNTRHRTIVGDGVAYNIVVYTDTSTYFSSIPGYDKIQGNISSFAGQIIDLRT